MADNKPIFRPSFGNRPDELIGRENVIETIVNGLQTYPGSSERSTLIVGQRGMGKTALLLEIADLSHELDYIPVRVTCGENMLDNLIELLQRAGSRFVDDSKPQIKGFNAGALGFSFGLTFTEEVQHSFGFRVKLEMICEKLSQNNKQVLILVDEVDPSIKEMRELATCYQELAGIDSHISIVMAGLPSSISDILSYKTLTFLNRAQRISLDLIPINEVEAYYHSAFARASLNASSEIIRKAAVSTDGFPYKIQLIGYYLTKLANGANPIDEELLSVANKTASSEIDTKVFHAMLTPLSALDFSILLAMAQNGTRIKIADLESATGLSHGTMQTYRRRLIDSGIVYAPHRGELCFVLPQLADYILNNDDH